MGPLLYLLYTADIPAIFSQYSSAGHFYADDVQALVHGPPSDQLALTGFHDNSSKDISSTTLRLQTFRLQTFRLLLYTSAQDSYTSNFCFSKSLFSSIPTSTYTMIL